MRNDYLVEDRKSYALIVMPEKVVVTHSGSLETALREACDKGYKTIVVDCKDMRMFDTAGLGYLATYQKKQKDRGGEIKLINVADDYVKNMFRIIELNKLLSIEEVCLSFFNFIMAIFLNN